MNNSSEKLTYIAENELRVYNSACERQKKKDQKYIDNQPTRTIKGGSISIKQDDVIDNKSFAMRLLGETYRDNIPTFETPSPIYTAKMSLYIGNAEGELGHIFVPYELCEGDYIDVDYKNKKVTHKRTKTKWVATEESIIEIYLYDNEYLTDTSTGFILGYNPNSIDLTGTENQQNFNEFTNVFGVFGFAPWDTAFYVRSVPEFYEMTAEDIKDYLINNNCVVYLDIDEPIYTDVTDTDYGQALLGWAEHFKNDFWLELASSGSIELSYTSKVDSAMYDAKAEASAKGYEQGKTDENKAWWNNITNNGTRKDYEYGFYSWDCEYIRPPIKIIPTVGGSGSGTQGRIINMFANNKSLLKVEKEYFDLSKCTYSDTSQTAGQYCVFRFCSKLKHIEDIGIQAGYMYGTYSGCYALETIEMQRIKKTTPIHKDAFQSCNSLIKITFSDDSEIGRSINFQYSPLSKASIINIIEHLCADTDITGQTLTLNLNAVKKAFETEEGANNGNTSAEWIEWATDVADGGKKPDNWTISLV